MTYRWAGISLSHRPPRFGFWNRGRQFTAPILAMSSLWWGRHRRRMRLAAVAALGERTMLDLGFDPDIVRAEAAKPFWRP